MSIDNPHRPIRGVKASERLAAQNTSVHLQSCDTMSTEELRKRYIDLRRAWLAFEKFVRVDCGIEI